MAEETGENTGSVEANPAENMEETKTVDVSDNGGETDNNPADSESSNGEDNKESKSEEVPVALDFDAMKLPEGVTVSDEEKAQLAKDMERFGITTQEGLQSFIDWAFEQSKEASDKMSANSAKAAEDEKKEWEEIKSGWKTSLEGDADFGKEYDLNMKRANDTIEKFGGSEFTKWLDDMDVRGNPALVKTFARIGKQLEDARLLTGTKTTESPERKKDRYNQPLFVYKD